LIQLAIFDLDGTLIDSAPDIVAAANTLLVEAGHSPLPEKTITAAIGEGLKQLVFGIFPESHTDPELWRKLERDFYRIYETTLLKRTKIYAGLDQFMREFKGQVAIVTNKPAHLTQLVIEGLGLNQYKWLRVFGADSLPNRKPDPLPLLEVMKAADVDRHQTVMIGDGIPDMIAARRAGVHSIAVEYGYTSLDILRAQGASLTLPSLHGLSGLLREAADLPPREISV
jgi:phosphoglycolate phosphatase